MRHRILIALVGALAVSCARMSEHAIVGHQFPAVPLHLDLSGPWQFRLDPDDVGRAQRWTAAVADDPAWTTVTAPSQWEPADYDGVAWYRRVVTVSPLWVSRELTLNLGVVDDGATVFWNEEVIGESHAIEDSNRFTIPAALVQSLENVLALRVVDRGGPGGLNSGPLWLEPITPWSATTLDIAEMPGLYTTPAGEHVDFNINAENPLPEGYFADIHVVVTPCGREPIHDVTHGPVWINPSPDYTKVAGILLGELPPGWYGVDLTLSSGGADVAHRRRAFVVTQRVQELDPESSPFALNGGALFHLDPDAIASEGAMRLRQLAATGCTWGRNDLWWGQIEPEPGAWDWLKCDSVVSRFHDQGITLLGILSYCSAWSDDHAPTTPEMREEWLNYVRHIVGRYGPPVLDAPIIWQKGGRGNDFARVRHWEVWNEPNILPFWPPDPDADDYAALLHATHDAIKEIDPSLTVVGCATSGVPLRFLRRVLDLGGGEWMDVLSVHPYQGEPPTDWSRGTSHGNLRELRAELDRRGLQDLPIWITEEGWPTVGSTSYETQANYLVEFYTQTLAMGLADRIHWFNLTDWGSPEDSAGGHFGLVEIDHTPKPSFAAFNNLIARLHDFDSVEDHSDLDAQTWRYVFHRPEGRDHGEERVTVIWTGGEQRSIEIPEEAQVCDVVGHPIERITLGLPVSPRTELIGPSPIYLVEELTP